MAGMVFTFKAMLHCNGLQWESSRCASTAETDVTASAAPIRVDAVPGDLADVFRADLPLGWEQYGSDMWICPECVTRRDRERKKR